MHLCNYYFNKIAGTATNVTTNANLTGDITSVGNATTLTNAPVIAKVLTGYVSGAGVVAATDTILQAIQKLNGNAVPLPNSMVRLNTANGYGSTNTKIRRFTNTVTSQGADITYADSATLGGSFTVNTAGGYSMSFNDQFTAAAELGISLNTTVPTTTINAIPVAEVLCAATTAAANYTVNCSTTMYLIAGSIIRAHTVGADSGTSVTLCEFTITRVS